MKKPSFAPRTHALIILLGLAACTPPGAAPAPSTDGASGLPALTHPRKLPPKAVLPPAPPPPNVTVEILPDGSRRVTIREPRCPSCQPWVF